MADQQWLAERFAAHRGHLLAVAYRMLGSYSEADDAVQEAWLRISRGDPSEVVNLGGWLTTVVGRVCLDALRSRKARREEPLGAADVAGPADPEQDALLADSVGVALLVVLDTLAPVERLAFVLHDMFAVPFAEIGPIVGRSPGAAKMLASRARRRVRQAGTAPDPDRARQREVVRAFLAAARNGDFAALLTVLDPEVVARADVAGAPAQVQGAAEVARQALAFSARSPYAQLALINGAVGIVVAPRGRLSIAMTFTIVRGRILDVEIIADPERLRCLDLRSLGVRA